MTESSDEIGLVWFRRDLRLDDNPAWAAATSSRGLRGARVRDRPAPARSRRPVPTSPAVATLQALDYSLAEFGGRLLVRIGDPAKVVPETVAKLGVDTVFWNADVTPYAVARDARSPRR